MPALTSEAVARLASLLGSDESRVLNALAGCGPAAMFAVASMADLGVNDTINALECLRESGLVARYYERDAGCYAYRIDPEGVRSAVAALSALVA